MTLETLKALRLSILDALGRVEDEIKVLAPAELVPLSAKSKKVVQATARHFQVDPRYLLTTRKRRDYCEARYAATLILQHTTGASYESISRHFNLPVANIDHALRRAREIQGLDPKFKELVKTIIDEVSA